MPPRPKWTATKSAQYGHDDKGKQGTGKSNDALNSENVEQGHKQEEHEHGQGKGKSEGELNSESVEPRHEQGHQQRVHEQKQGKGKRDVEWCLHEWRYEFSVMAAAITHVMALCMCKGMRKGKEQGHGKGRDRVQENWLYGTEDAVTEESKRKSWEVNHLMAINETQMAGEAEAVEGRLGPKLEDSDES